MIHQEHLVRVSVRNYSSTLLVAGAESWSSKTCVWDSEGGFAVGKKANDADDLVLNELHSSNMLLVAFIR